MHPCPSMFPLRKVLTAGFLLVMVTADAYGQESDFMVFDEGFTGEYLPGDSNDYGGEDLVAELPEPATGGFLQFDDVLKLDLGIEHACALLAGGHIKCWGGNFGLQLGDGSNELSNRPRAVVGITDAIAVSAGYWHSCAVHASGQVSCWGDPGRGKFSPESAPVATPMLIPGIENAVDVVAGIEHTCALLSDGGVMCWGGNEHGQLGNGTLSDSLMPTAVPGIRSATMVSSSGSHTCVGEQFETRVQVKCWGANGQGQSGDPSFTDVLAPRQVTWGNVTDINAGIETTCYVKADWYATCFGKNSEAQLGLGSQTAPIASPTSVYGYTAVTNVSGGSLHSCGRTRDGFVRCWGRNSSGELGLGHTRTSSSHWRPYHVVMDLWGTALKVEASHYFSCALLMDRSVVCWGQNNGKLGNGTFMSSSKPVEVAF